MMEQLHDSSSDSESELSMPTIDSSSSSDSVSSSSTSDSSLSDSESSSSKCSSVLSGSQSSVTTSSSFSRVTKSVQKSPPTCFFDPSTYKYQSFSIPEKIVFYIAKNVTNAETYQKLIESCKYFFKVNPVIVIPELKCSAYASSDDHRWSVNNGERTYFQFKNPQTINFKVWVTQKFITYYLSASQMIPKIYRNDATDIALRTKDQDITWKEFLFFAGNAETVDMTNSSMKYENGKAVTMERIVENLPKIQYLKYYSNNDGIDITSNTFNKLMEIQHFKNISYLSLYNVPENVNVETIFNFILENKHIQIDIRYRSQISDAYKERIREYSDRLQNEDGCNSSIGYSEVYGWGSDGSISFSLYSLSSAADDSDLLFPWNNEEDDEWELPWDKKE